MAYRDYGMWEILDVLRRVGRGEGYREAARQTGRSRNTVRRYVKLAVKLGWQRGVDKPTEELAVCVLAQLQPGPQMVSRPAHEVLSQHHEEIKGWIEGAPGERRGLTLTKIHRLLTRRGVKVSYGTLYRFAKAECNFGKRPATVRMAPTAAGDVAEVDFGKMGLVPYPATGKKRVLHALIVTLVHSRHQYVYLTHSQGLASVIPGLEQAWEYFGGVPARVIVDNMKTAVVKADRYEPTFQRTFNEYAEHRGFVIDAAPVVSPKCKPHVERAVQYVRENFFRGEEFMHRDDAQRRAEQWCT